MSDKKIEPISTDVSENMKIFMQNLEIMDEELRCTPFIKNPETCFLGANYKNVKQSYPYSKTSKSLDNKSKLTRFPPRFNPTF